MTASSAVRAAKKQRRTAPSPQSARCVTGFFCAIGPLHEVSEQTMVPNDKLTIRSGVAAWPTVWQGQNLRDILVTRGHKDDRSFTGNAPGGPNAGRQNVSPRAVKPSYVVEVSYDHFSGGRFLAGSWQPLLYLDPVLNDRRLRWARSGKWNMRVSVLGCRLHRHCPQPAQRSPTQPFDRGAAVWRGRSVPDT